MGMTPIGEPAMYICDRPGCGTEAKGTTTARPKGWLRAQWQPGILRSWLTNAVPRDLWYCSNACAENDSERRSKLTPEPPDGEKP